MRLREKRLKNDSRKKDLESSSKKSSRPQLAVYVNCRIAPGRYCAKCCYDTEMQLTKEDIERIERLGYPREYFVQETGDGIPRLKNINGHCVFLDPGTGKCTIYPYKPLGCRLYPLVYMPGKGVVVDPLCPKAHEIPKTVIEKYKRYVLDLVRKIYGQE